MPGYDEFLHATLEILRGQVAADKRVTPTAHIQNDLGLDSLAVMEVVADLEDRFELTIPTEILAQICTAEDVAAALCKLSEVA